MDKELGQMMSLIQMYRKDAPLILKYLKDHECQSRNEAEVIFSTTHKAKGLEYDHVVINKDYINGESFEEYLLAIKNTESNDLKQIYKNRVIEEFNMIYVALTRAMHSVDCSNVEFLNSTFLDDDDKEDLFLNLTNSIKPQEVRQ